jgi:hypothetical protein
LANSRGIIQILTVNFITCQANSERRQFPSDREKMKRFEMFCAHLFFTYAPLCLVPSAQGCQTVYFQTKNPNLGKFWRAFDWKMWRYFMSIWYFLCLFGAFFPVWVSCTEKNLATLLLLLLDIRLKMSVHKNAHFFASLKSQMIPNISPVCQKAHACRQCNLK